MTMNIRARIDLLRRVCGKLPERVVPVRVWLPRKAGGEPPGEYPTLAERVVRIVYDRRALTLPEHRR